MPADTNIPVGHASALRGSERVAIAIAVEVSGIDSSGSSFHEEAHTEHVTKNGASIVLKHSVPAEQPVNLRCGRRSVGAPARIVGLISRRKEDHVYGVSLIEPDANFWGIFFPPQSEIDAAFVRLPLQCATCSNREVILLDELEFTVFAASGKLSRKCRHCAHRTSWETIPNSPSHRRTELKPRAHGRTRIRKLACICQPGWEDVVEVADISRGGLCFRSRREYPTHVQIQVAVPYTPGSANIFVPGRIAWQRSTESALKLYGIDYARG